MTAPEESSRSAPPDSAISTGPENRSPGSMAETSRTSGMVPSSIPLAVPEKAMEGPSATGSTTMGVGVTAVSMVLQVSLLTTVVSVSSFSPSYGPSAP